MKKKTVVTIFQVLVSVSILGWIFHDPAKNAKMWDAVHHDLLWMWILGGVIAYGIVEILGATRWLVLLRVQNIHIPWLRLVRLLMIGIFFNQILPGGTGGDVVKIFYLLKETPNKKTEAVLAVLMDRLVGLIGLIFVAGTVVICNWTWLTQGIPVPHFELSWFFSYGHMKEWLSQIPLTSQLVYILMGILGFTIIGLIVSFIITGLGLAHKLPAKFPKRDIFVDLSLAYNLYAKAWKSSLLAILLSFGVHIFSFLLFYAAARAIHVMVPLFEFCAIMPIINTVTSLPISVGGAGVREGLFQTILPALTAVKATDATVLSLLGYVIMLFWGLCGILVYLTYKPSGADDSGPGSGPGPGGPDGGPKTLNEIKEEVEKLEHEIAEGE